jgi:YXWGXW repeat-containing protein
MRCAFVSSAVCALMLLGSAAANAQISFGIQIGEPPPPRAYRVPARPGPEFVWVEGYWYPQGRHYRWHDGYWTRPPFEGAYWVDPYYAGGRYVAGYWEDGHRRFEHDHRWDRERRRDFREDRWEDRHDRREDRR